MSQVLTAKEIGEVSVNPSWTAYLPAILAIGGAFLMMFAKYQAGANFISDEALMMLALAGYLLAAVFQLTNLYAPSEMAQKIGLWTATAGVFFNLSSWLVRWVAGYISHPVGENHSELTWFFRSVPFANLYDLSLAFAFGAGIATLFIAHRKDFEVLGAFSLPLAALILVLARFIGGEFINLPPVLDRFWRPIHVGIASLSYGITLVCFVIAVVYLLKDRVKVESMAIWASIFAIAVFGTISKFSVFTEGVYRSGLFIPDSPKPANAMFRLDIPYVGIALVIAGILCLGTIISFLMYLYQNNEGAKKVGHLLLKLSLIAQIIAVAFWVSGVKSTTQIEAKLNQQLTNSSTQFVTVGKEIATKELARRSLSAQQLAQEFNQISTTQFEAVGKEYLQQNGSQMYLNLGTNPVEFSGVLTALAGILFVILFSFKTDKLRERLPSLESLDSLMYKTASLAFAGLAMLLITGAIWANESWGRPWGFDSKETGALVAWLTYGLFLHLRISRGMTGRGSAYFAIIGFFFVIFTYLGVSYLLPGLHSYA
jgi:ABC-type transport system involved in cytochrome c biogenesis permease subunit